MKMSKSINRDRSGRSQTDKLGSYMQVEFSNHDRSGKSQTQVVAGNTYW